jgi:excisionase family DNA binding protein
MENVSFENLPQAVNMLLNKLEDLEKMISKHITTTTPDKEEDQLLSISEAAEFLNLKKSTIYKRKSEGRIPYMKIGKKLYFSKSDLWSDVRKGKHLSNEELNTTAQSIIANASK